MAKMKRRTPEETEQLGATMAYATFETMVRKVLYFASQNGLPSTDQQREEIVAKFMEALPPQLKN
jgi:hypothetical protein